MKGKEIFHSLRFRKVSFMPSPYLGITLEKNVPSAAVLV